MTDDKLRAAVRRLLDEYWEDNSRPPSFVTIGDLKTALAASATDEGPERFAREQCDQSLDYWTKRALEAEEQTRIRDARPAVPALDVEIARVAFRRAQAQGISFDLLVFWRHFAREYAALSPKEPTDDRR